MSTKKRFYLSHDRGFTDLCDRQDYVIDTVADDPEGEVYLQDLCDLLNKGWEATEAEQRCGFSWIHYECSLPVGHEGFHKDLVATEEKSHDSRVRGGVSMKHVYEGGLFYVRRYRDDFDCMVKDVYLDSKKLDYPELIDFIIDKLPDPKANVHRLGECDAYLIGTVRITIEQLE